MKTPTLFIPAYLKEEVNEDKVKSILKELPTSLLVAYSIQYKHQAEKIKLIMSKYDKKITGFIQVLGCFKPNLTKFKHTQAILLISNGRFHAVSLAQETGLPIYIYNLSELHKISQDEIEALKRKKKAAYMNYLNSKRIGIIVSTKPGQNRLKEAEKLKVQLQKQNKEVYLFTTNNINLREFENFNISCFINTACPRLDFDSNKIINIWDLNFKDN